MNLDTLYTLHIEASTGRYAYLSFILATIYACIYAYACIYVACLIYIYLISRYDAL